MNIIIMRTVGPPQKAVGPGQPPRLPPPKSGTGYGRGGRSDFVSTDIMDEEMKSYKKVVEKLDEYFHI